MSINALLNHAYVGLEIDKRSPFSRVKIAGEGTDAHKRGTFSNDQLVNGYKEALASGSSVALLLPILGETGCRLAEVVGLRVEDVDLEARVLHIRPNDMRRLKTTGSERSISLTTTAVLAMEKVLEQSGDVQWVFPRYLHQDGFRATHASNAISQWMRPRWNMTAHSLRHTFRDRLRSAEVPLEAIDQLGGWSSVGGVGTRYGKGYSIEHLRRYVEKISISLELT